LFRLTLGLNFFMHGFARLFTGLGRFVAADEKPFLKQGIVPMPVVHYFLTIVPFIEVTIGVLLLLGFFTRWALFAGALFMMILIFGTTAKQDWGAAGNQMLYAAFYCFLIYRIKDNWFALDNYRRR
jgi:thiosulfate dehydrogenase [quinone] large subunit